MSSPAWYSVLQYVPRLERAEGANIGVLLFAPEAGGVNLRLSPDNATVKRLFGSAAVDDVRLEAAKRGLYRRVISEGGSAQTISDLRNILRRECNQLQFGPLVPVQPHARTLETLYEDLVVVPPRRRERRNHEVPELIAIVERLAAAVPIERDVQVRVPLMGRTKIEADFAYTNGQRHLVRGERFAHKAAKRASELGTQGLLLAKESQTPHRLVVVPAFAADVPASDITRILEHHGVRVVSADDLPAFEQEILEQAH